MSSRNHKRLSWHTKKWPMPKLSPQAKTLIWQCTDIPEMTPSRDIEEIIKNSNEFPMPFPIETVRLAELKKSKNIEQMEENIASAYPVVHERALRVMAEFIIYKREYGSDIEKKLYKNMTVPALIDRLLKKRAMCYKPRHDLDDYVLINGEKGDKWEAVGTADEKPPLTLDNVLSYDEQKLSALVYVSSSTFCINDGARSNKGVVNEVNTEEVAYAIGVAAPRFQREDRMDGEDILITDKENPTEIVEGDTNRAVWRKMWTDFYVNKPISYDLAKAELRQNTSQAKNEVRHFTDRYVLTKSGAIFDNQTYYKRLCIIIETIFIAANARLEGKEYGYLHIPGIGLGADKISQHQSDIYMLACKANLQRLEKRSVTKNIYHVNFAGIKISRSLSEMWQFYDAYTFVMPNYFLAIDRFYYYDKERYSVEDKNPSTMLKRTGYACLDRKDLIIAYPWNANAHPGNEFWMGKLTSSDESAAACSTQISELHNAHINPAVIGARTRVACSKGLLRLQDYALTLQWKRRRRLLALKDDLPPKVDKRRSSLAFPLWR